MTAPETPTLATQLERMAEREDFQHCRTINHPWKVVDIYTVPEGRCWEFVCRSCHGERQTIYPRNGGKPRHRYDMPDGYYLVKGSDDDDVPGRAELAGMLREVMEDFADRRRQQRQQEDTAA